MKLLGSSWKTSLAGLVGGAAMLASHVDPSLLNSHPNWKLAASVISALAVYLGMRSAADSSKVDGDKQMKLFDQEKQ